MKFSAVSTIVLLGSALAAPAPVQKKGVTESIGLIINTLNNTVTTNLNQINGLVAGVKNNVDASLQVAAQVGADYAAIAAALTEAAAGITAATTTGVGGVAGQAIGLTNAQIMALTQSVKDAQALIQAINATVTLTATNLAPVALATIQNEINAVMAAAAPFVGPLTTFANAVVAARFGLGIVVTGLQGAVTGLAGILTNLLGGLL
ncbi:hypothetical protein BKA64DRAFT_703699 [Cadophora sp. MPI-SDFR-AT-0126]|nr:hypothetical protein BKA64DRAFT_703699 [Leotiomycetes sp. MPI-SDFR-AT-0126]